MALTESHEKKKAWTQIWYLTQKDSAGNYEYYQGLQLDERAELIRDISDFLDYERGIELGSRLGQPDTTPTESDELPVNDPAPPLDIHRPEHYSFGEGRLWIPWAEDAISGAKRGRYRAGYPTGMVLHWTAGHRNGLTAGNELMRNTGMLYLIGDKDGNLAQSDSLQFHGYHAGKSSHKYANGYVSDEFIGLELQAAGHLHKKPDGFYSWWGGKIPAGEVKYSEKRDNIVEGFYHLYTQAQMLLTRKLVCWLYLNNPSAFSVDRLVGHDEVSPGRKVDPGGSTTTKDYVVLSMPELRKLIWNDVDRISEARKKA